VQEVIVDGYNVIYADPELRRAMLRQPQSARERLATLLARYARERDIRVTLVFDGARPSSDSRSEVPGRLQVVFSRAGQSADDLILSMVRHHPNARAVIVVSSDETDIGRSARDLGAQVLGAGTFFTRISRATRAGDNAGEMDGEKPTEIDVDYWIRQFEKRRRTPRDGE